jgi:hypothetical protein
MKKRAPDPAANPLAPERQAHLKELAALRREECEAEASLDRIRQRIVSLTGDDYRPNEDVTWWALQMCRSSGVPWDDELESLIFGEPLRLFNAVKVEASRKKASIAHMAQYAAFRCKQIRSAEERN